MRSQRSVAVISFAGDLEIMKFSVSLIQYFGRFLFPAQYENFFTKVLNVVRWKMKIRLLCFTLFVALFCFVPRATAQHYTAAHFKSAADATVHATEPNALLLKVWSDNVLTTGMADSWNYLYATRPATGKPIFYYAHSAAAGIVLDSISNIPFIGIATVSFPWFDSDSALVLANKSTGNAFAATHLMYKIQASLVQPLVPNSRVGWAIDYISATDNNDRQSVIVDAVDSSQFTSGINDTHEKSGMQFRLDQNYPNPFNPSTLITYQLPATGRVSLVVYSLTGTEVARLADEVQAAGVHRVVFNAGQLPTGIYFYRLQTGERVLSRKMTLIK